MKKVLCMLVLAPLIGRPQITQTPAHSPSHTSGQEAPSSVSKQVGSPIASGQIETPGIQWTKGLSWLEIKEKAKRENKYIFMDCYTTWCGPCKMMDRNVYLNGSVGELINHQFIAVKVQIDKTKDDNAFVKSWYKDAAEINKHYFVEGYPTFLFFSPNGSLVHKDMGARSAENFILMAKTALIPGKSTNDEFAEYQQLINAYKRGEVKYDRLPFMITIAKKMRDTVSRELVRLHEKYISQLSDKDRYTKENIEFWTTLKLSEESKIVHFFYKDGSKIDKVMNKKGFSELQINKCIQQFIVAPFISSQYKKYNIKTDATIINTVTGNLEVNATNTTEADWKKLYQIIQKDFNNHYANSNLFEAKAIWYEKNGNWMKYTRYRFKLLRKYTPDLKDKLVCYNINQFIWNIFLHINDSRFINEGILWIGKIVQKQPDWSDCLDTYANLLYKIGRKEEAIQWQEKVVSLDSTNKFHMKALEQMKKGEPTYGVN